MYKSEDYLTYSAVEHVLARPETYLGCDKVVERTVGTLEAGKIVKKVVTVPEAMTRLFAEIMSNATDNVIRSRLAKVKPTQIKVKIKSKSVSIENDGIPIPVEMHSSGIYVPELIFGILRTSGNYEGERSGCGKNGYGAKLVNILSTKFTVEVGDSNNKKYYHQEWSNNMGEKTEPVIKDYKGKSYVRITYRPEFERFGLKSNTKELMNLMLKMIIDFSFSAEIPINVNGKKIDCSKVSDYMNYYNSDGSEDNLIYSKNFNKIKLRMGALFTHNKGKSISFCNGMETADGGIHVDAAYEAIARDVIKRLNNLSEDADLKGCKISMADFKRHVTVIVAVDVKNPGHSSQTKTKLTYPPMKFSIPKKLAESILGWELIKILSEGIEKKILKQVKKSDGRKRKNVKLDKGEDANKAGTKDSSDCVLYLTEGDSASGYANHMISLFKKGRDTMGVLPFKGKPLNVKKCGILRVSKNKQIIELNAMLGLKSGHDYSDEKSFTSLRYGKVIILADSDVDGYHILGLILNFFQTLYPSLVTRNYVQYIKTPTHRVLSRKKTLKFYSEHDFSEWYKTCDDKNAQIMYYKGLGSSSNEEIKSEQKNIKYVDFEYDTEADAKMDLAFHPDNADLRKDWLIGWEPNYKIEQQTVQKISEFVDHCVAQFSLDSVKRAMPNLVGGLKESQRKIIHGSRKKWGAKYNKNPQKVKVAILAPFVAAETGYHHGEACLCSAVTAMTTDRIGTNNMPYFVSDGQFGTRNKGGKDAAKPRYAFVRPQWWWNLVFIEDDLKILEHVVDEGNICEPHFYLPIIPMIMVNGSQGIATAFSTFIPNHNIYELIEWLENKLSGKPLPVINPWYKGFKGKIEIVAKEENDLGVTDDTLGADDVNPTHSIKMATYGKFEVSGKIIKITELPIGRHTHDYSLWLNKLIEDGELKEYDNYSKTETVEFHLKGFVKEPTYTSLRLRKLYGLKTMRALVDGDVPELFISSNDIIEKYYDKRFPFFAKRKEDMITRIKITLEKLKLKHRFVEEYLSGKIEIGRRKIKLVAEEMKVKGFDKEFLNQINLMSLTEEELTKLKAKIAKESEALIAVEGKSCEEMWLSDLRDLKMALKKADK